MQPTHPKKRSSVFNKNYHGDVFKLFDKAYEGNRSNEIGMIKVIMRQNQSGEFTDQNCEVPRHVSMNNSGVLGHSSVMRLTRW